MKLKVNRNQPALRWAALLGAVGMAVTACGGSTPAAPADHFTTVMNYNAADTEAYLYKCAQTEGQVNYYTDATLSKETLAPAFEKKYPGVKVVITEATTQLVQKIADEAAAGKDTFDVLGSSYGNIPRDGTYFAKFDSPGRKLVQPSLSQPYYLGYGGYVEAVAYNPKLAPTGTFSSDWKSLLAPALKGKIYFPTDSATYQLIGMLKAEYGLDFLKSLASQVRVSGGTGRAVADQVVAGTAPISMAASVAYVKRYPATAPLKFQVMSPALALYFIASIDKKAPHPCAARLMVDWLANPDGGGVVETQVGNALPYKGVALFNFEVPGNLPVSQWNIVYGGDAKMLKAYKTPAEALKDWTNIFQTVFVASS